VVWTSAQVARFDDAMEIHRADRAYRTRSALLLGAIALLCIILLWQLNLWLGRVNAELMGSDPDTVRRWLRALLAGLGVSLALPAAALGINLRRFALASRIEGRFPPREWKTWRDVRILRDSAALAWARRVELAGASMLAVAALLILWAAIAWWRFA
jgi:hypothetical protein